MEHDGSRSMTGWRCRSRLAAESWAELRVVHIFAIRFFLDASKRRVTCPRIFGPRVACGTTCWTQRQNARAEVLIRHSSGRSVVVEWGWFVVFA